MHTRSTRPSFTVVALLAIVACTQSTTEQQSSPPSDEAGAPAAGNTSAASTTPGVTARAAFAKARERALAWQADARLEKIMTIYARKDGTVSTESMPGFFFPWQFIFSSASAKKAWEVDTNGSEVRESEATAWMRFNPISEDYVDSDAALSEAVRNGYEADEGNYVELTVQVGSQTFDEPVWAIGQVGHTTYVISARTGRFVRRLAPQ